MINYKTDAPTEEGWYLLNVNGEHTVAELLVFADGDHLWQISGVDYDAWTHDQSHTYDISVVCRFDLDKIAASAQEHAVHGDNAEVQATPPQEKPLHDAGGSGI